MAIIRRADQAMFNIAVDGMGEGELRVVRLRADEGLSRLFSFKLELLCEDPQLSFDDIVGRATAVCLTGQQADDRYFNGIIRSFEQGTIGPRWTHYFAEVVPMVWRLLHRADSRIFQSLSVPDILGQVLDDAGIPSTRYRLEGVQGSHPLREYCVQYQESDWSFLSRLMEEEGIFYFFEHTEDAHVLVMGDDPSAHGEISAKPGVTYREATGFIAGEEYISGFRYLQQVRTGTYSMRDYNFETPSANLSSQTAADVDKDLEAFEFPGKYRTSGDGANLAIARLQEQQATRKVAIGTSVCCRLVPGARFTLEDYPRADFNREYLITDCKHTGFEPQMSGEALVEVTGELDYSNEFRCIPSDVSYRPPRRTTKPFIRGTQTAVVVGPPGEEIYTDRYGRVKVHFFWDRKSEADKSSSCWMRVAQLQAGAGFGAVYLPRVGQEVLVSFLNGDPDFPYVVGGIYNENQMPPYDLPDAKTKMVIKSSSSPDSGGFNELRFEDKAGEEQIFMHAQKNMDVRIGEDRFETIDSNAHLMIGQDQTIQVENERHTTINASDFTLVKTDRSLTIQGKDAIDVADSRSTAVGGDVIDEFGGSHSEKTSMDYFLQAMGISLKATSGITLECGGGKVVIDSAGVTLKGMTVTLDGSMVMIASGPGSPGMTGSAGSLVSPVEPTPPDEADLADPGRMEEIKADQVALQQGKYGTQKVVPFKPEEEEVEEKSFIEIELKDEEGNPVAGEPYEIKLPDGERVARGTLDTKGYARVDGIDEGNCEVTFPKLDKEAWEPE